MKISSLYTITNRDGVYVLFYNNPIEIKVRPNTNCLMKYNDIFCIIEKVDESKQFIVYKALYKNKVGYITIIPARDNKLNQYGTCKDVNYIFGNRTDLKEL